MTAISLDLMLPFENVGPRSYSSPLTAGDIVYGDLTRVGAAEAAKPGERYTATSSNEDKDNDEKFEGSAWYFSTR